MSKRRAFQPLRAVLGKKFKKMKRKKIVYTLIDFQATLQPRKNFLHPSNLFKVFFIETNHKVCQQGGLLSHWGNLFSKKCFFYWKSLIWACWPTVPPPKIFETFWALFESQHF